MMAALFAAQDKLRVLCLRQFQNSIKESFHAELKLAIESQPELAALFDIGVDYLRCKETGSEFIFRGLDRHLSSIKSLADIDIAIVEEAEDTKEEGWQALEPTLRKNGSEIWPIWNPKDEGSPVDLRFRKNPPADGVIVEINWRDNPWFPQALNDQRLRDQKMLDPAAYAWIWEGAYLIGQAGAVYRAEWFKEYMLVHAHAKRCVHSWDTAYKEDQHNDPSSCTIWMIDDIKNEAYLVFVVNERMDYPTLKQRVIDMARLFPADAILIEDKASGQSLIQELRGGTSLPVVTIKPEGGKLTRAVASAGMVESGRVLLPQYADWLSEYKKQMLYFCADYKGHDDMVDSTSQFLNWWKTQDTDVQFSSFIKKQYGL